VNCTVRVGNEGNALCICDVRFTAFCYAVELDVVVTAMMI
jgi:hypothetical protein